MSLWPKIRRLHEESGGNWTRKTLPIMSGLAVWMMIGYMADVAGGGVVQAVDGHIE